MRARCEVANYVTPRSGTSSHPSPTHLKLAHRTMAGHRLFRFLAHWPARPLTSPSRRGEAPRRTTPCASAWIRAVWSPPPFDCLCAFARPSHPLQPAPPLSAPAPPAAPRFSRPSSLAPGSTEGFGCPFLAANDPLLPRVPPPPPNPPAPSHHSTPLHPPAPARPRHSHPRSAPARPKQGPPKPLSQRLTHPSPTAQWSPHPSPRSPPPRR